ncbi:RnfABCDGE type electron transport complex subunit D [Acholeplasma hippikon]|nr:RnfABCDGE type electron transport complex subunit D [Acholeplasma hippikon]
MNIAQRNRIIVAASLFSILLASATIFGPTVFLIGLAGIATSFVVEFLNSKLRKEKFDWTSFAITPLVITLLTTPTIISQVWMVVVATAFGVFFAKALFGGEGKYIFNPATVGLIFIALAFPVYVNNFFDPVAGEATTQTLATIFKNTPNTIVENFKILDLLMGNYAGAIGTTYKLGILILGIVLMVLQITDWRVPVTFLGGYFVLSLINFLGKGYGANAFVYALYSVLMGHLLFSAMFVATDPQTVPLYKKGRWIYAAILALITWMIQNIWAFNPLAPNTEGTIYSITLMNAVVGLIDVATVPKVKENPVMEELEA